MMAGLGSKALAFGEPINKKKYNGIEFEDALGINENEAQLRNLDPQVGRWWEIDPKIENQEIWSPFVSNNDNPVRFADPLGDEADDCCKEMWGAVVQKAKDVTNFTVSAVNAFVTNQIGGAGRTDPSVFSDPHDASVSQGGQIFGDLFTIGVAAIVDVGGAVTTIGSAGTLAAPAISLMAQQTLVAAPTAIKNLVADFENNDRVSATSKSSSSGSNSAGKSAGGQAIDKNGNKIGPSGKPQVNTVRLGTRKLAKDAARSAGKGKPVLHNNPKKGGNHFHPTDLNRNKIPNSTHFEF